MRRLHSRLAVIALTLTLAGAVTATPAFAGSAKAPTRGQAASGWLARQLTDRSHFVDVISGVSYPDQGLTIDAILAFAATGTANSYGARAASWLARPAILSGYIGSGTESYAGATAKTILAVEVRGLNPARFGGVNLLKRLGKLLKSSGRYSDHSKYGDYSSAFSQALAVVALTRHGGAPARAVSFLVKSECKNGGFPLEFAQKTCTSDPDATAMDVQALLAAGRPTAARRGLRWLAHDQRKDGGFVDVSGAAPNANSTGLAGQALAAGRWHAHAGHARHFLVTIQLGCSAAYARRGAIAFDTTGYAHASAVRGTAQGILGFADISLAKISAHGAHGDDPRFGCSA